MKDQQEVVYKNKNKLVSEGRVLIETVPGLSTKPNQVWSLGLCWSHLTVSACFCQSHMFPSGLFCSLLIFTSLSQSLLVSDSLCPCLWWTGSVWPAAEEQQFPSGGLWPAGSSAVEGEKDLGTTAHVQGFYYFQRQKNWKWTTDPEAVMVWTFSSMF